MSVLAEKEDVYDWLEAGHTVEELQELADKAPDADEWIAQQQLRQRTKSRREEDEAASVVAPFPVVRVLEGDAPTPSSELVSDLILDRDVNLWAGHGGSAKTVAALTVAVCVAVGRPVFGTRTVNRTGTVLLVVPEDGHPGARMIIDAIAEGLGLNAEERALCTLRLIMITDDTSVNLARDADRLAETALEHEAVLVVLDPLRNLIGGEAENDNDVAGACIDSLRREVCRRAGAAVLLNHHNRKPGKDSGDTSSSAHETRGAGGWVNGARLVFNVAKKEERVTMTCTKANRVSSQLKHELKLSIESHSENKAHWLRCTLSDANAGTTSETLTPGVGRALNTNELAALSCLNDEHEPGKRWSWSAWVEESGISHPSTLKSIKKRFLDARLIVAAEAGAHRNGGKTYYYHLSDFGRAVLARGGNATPSW
jgi:hypothetical protein